MLAILTIIFACAHKNILKQKGFWIIPNFLDEFICTLALEHADTFRPIQPIILETFHEAARIIIAMNIYVAGLCASLARDDILSNFRV